MNTQGPTTEVFPVVDAPPESRSSDVRSRRQLFAAAAAGLAALTAACSNDDKSDSNGGTTSGRSDAKATNPTQAPVSGRSGGGGSASEPDVRAKPGDIDGGRNPNNPTAKKPSAALAKDLPVATFAAGIEVLAINTYKATATAASAGKLGDVPPAVAEFVATVQGHHQAALDQWNLALSAGGQKQVSKPDPGLEPKVSDLLRQVQDVKGAAMLALMLEEVAAATYLAAIPKLQSPEGIGLAAALQPVDMQHAAVLHFVLGDYPVPDTFAKTDKALTPS